MGWCISISFHAQSRICLAESFGLVHVTTERYSETEAAFLSSVSWRIRDAIKFETESGIVVFGFFCLFVYWFLITPGLYNIGMLAQLDVFKSCGWLPGTNLFLKKLPVNLYCWCWAVTLKNIKTWSQSIIINERYCYAGCLTEWFLFWSAIEVGFSIAYFISKISVGTFAF